MAATRNPRGIVDSRKNNCVVRKKNASPEHDIQCEVVRRVKEHSPDIMFCATVGGVRLSMNQAKRMKAAGYLAGIPDLLFFEPRGEHVGLAIELKAKRGRVSAAQKQAIHQLNERGWRAVVCTGFDECVAVLRDYFDDDVVGF